MSSLRRQLNTWDGVALYVGIVVGSGIFFAPSNVAAAAPGPLAALLWTLGGLVAAAGAFCYAECGARLPKNGGFYVYYREVYGEGLAFASGWSAMLVTYPASIAAIAYVFGAYLAELLPIPPMLGAAAAVVLASAVNAIGVRTGARAQRILTAIKVAAIVLVGVAAFVARSPVETTVSAWEMLPASLLGAFVGILWTYSGWSDVSLVSGELRDPARSLGRTVVYGTAILVALYVLVQLAVSAVLPASVAAQSDRVFAAAVEHALGPELAVVVAGLVVVSTLGSINGTTLAAARLGWAMASDRLMPSWLARVHPRFGTPAASIAALGVVSLLYVLVSSFQALLGLFTFSVWIFYALTAVALLVLRHRRTGEPLAWRAPLGPVSPLIVIATAAGMTVLLLTEPEQRRLSWIGAALLATGFPVWLVWKRHRRSGSDDVTAPPA